jgi:RNA polymerase sigma factor (sigma-70 family)
VNLIDKSILCALVKHLHKPYNKNPLNISNEMLAIFLILNLFLLANVVNAYTVPTYLTQMQKDRINYIIQHPKTSIEMRTKINKILFIYYKQWAIAKAIQFKELHKHKCRNIQYNECVMFALMGLYKSILKFDGKHAFTVYAYLHIKGELYKGMTEQQPINILPKSYLRKKHLLEETKKIHNVYMKPVYLGFDDYKLNKNGQSANNNILLESIETKERLVNTWEKINRLPSFQRRIFHYKYSHDLHEVRTNKDVAELMECSEEWIRQNIVKSINTIVNM